MKKHIDPLIRAEAFSICYQKDIGAQKIAYYRVRNTEFLTRWEPKRSPDYYLPEEIDSRIRSGFFNAGAENAHRLGITCNAIGDLIGVINFTNITPYPFLACNLGFSIDENYQGRGYIKSALTVLLPVAFNSFGLNRIMANFMPKNFRSARLLHSLGFEIEGYAKRYLNINGIWEDHILTSLLASRIKVSEDAVTEAHAP